VRELSRDWRQNPLLLHTLRARGFRLGVFSLFVLLALAVAASLVASSRTMPSDALGIMLAIGMVFYSLSVPFLLAMVIPLAGRSYSRQMRSEIWLTGMPTREVAFGVLVPPILATATIIVVYPLMMAILLAATNVERVSAFLQDLISLGNTASEGLRATVAVLLVYLTFGLGSAYVPLLSRIRTFRIAWSPVLIAPVWGLLTLAAAVGPMVVISMETSRVFMSAFPAGDAYLEANQNLSFAAVLVIFMGGVMAMSESLAGRAGLRWLGDAVPEAAADLDWAFRERGFSDQPGDVQIRQWGDFTRRAWLWWRPRLKWAALGLAIALAPMLSSLVTSSFGVYRLLELGGLFAIPFVIPAMVFLPEMLWRSPEPVPLLPGRLLTGTFVLFLPCLAFIAIGILLGLLISYGENILYWWVLLPAFFQHFGMTLMLGVPGYAIWLALLPRKGRGQLLGGIGGVFVLFVPAAAGVWTLAAVPGLVLVSILLPALSVWVLLGLASILLQRLYMLEGRDAGGAMSSSLEVSGE
jgi:hypothetical protein